MAVQTYLGSCHCGNVRYEVDLDLSGPVTACNCSMCARAGWLLTFAEVDRFRLLSGEGLGDYQFNRRHIHHLFCPTCGIKAFSRGTRPDGKEMIAINVRCLDDVDLDALKVKKVDGRSF